MHLDQGTAAFLIVVLSVLATYVSILIGTR